MPGEPIQVGPFRGGLNTFSDESAIADNELVVVENFDPDVDGSLKSRPPAIEIGQVMPLQATGSPHAIASIRTTTGVNLVIGTDGVSKTYYFDGDQWHLITDTFAASAATEYNGFVWLVSPPTSLNPGGFWSLGGGFVSDINMPHGGDIVEFKSRLWIVRGKDAPSDGTRLLFSNVLGVDPFWPAAPNFIEVGLGDGENIVAVSVYFNMLLLWRTASIFRYTYTADPANGDVAIIVPGIGLENRDCLTPYESYFYFMYQGRAYEFINNRANQINQLVTFETRTVSGISDPFAVSTVGQRIVYQWYDLSYVYHLRTKTWTVWVSTVHKSFGKWLPRPNDAAGVAETVCFSNTTVEFAGPRDAPLLSMLDTYNERTETMMSVMQTKNYDYESATLIKRIFFWSVSAAWNGTMSAIQSTINFTIRPTWGQVLAEHTWGSLSQITWGILSSDFRKHTTTRTSIGTGPQRKESKVGRGAKFKRISYRVEVQNDGSETTAPVRLFYLTTYVRAGQVVSKDVS